MLILISDDIDCIDSSFPVGCIPVARTVTEQKLKVINENSISFSNIHFDLAASNISMKVRGSPIEAQTPLIEKGWYPGTNHNKGENRSQCTSADR